ncbi:TIGR01548 family HAD-type hydrolase [Halomicronema hongdechloris C2206]|uniref:TIGR01548 family HAD-type hydrolase n=1 Tax=Halomicronema hongdechloris C2206 TaxID=1641165 RepID=A0A1Z3HSZ7_9CYAN|nr:TIGR01548 family HAD-type hydrolase [Halomicronema hongdechloris]ASC73386.1 TIGR01548 family HAD-type hydrolase [Halomicronema hongdechloris C2206]
MNLVAAQPNAIVVFDIDGVLRDVSQSYRRAIADTVEHYTQGYRPPPEAIDRLKQEGIWNNDWQASRELIYRHFETQGQSRETIDLDFAALVHFFQSRYFGPDMNPVDRWSGYITQEAMLVDREYFEQLTAAGIGWGFFSGATRGSAAYVLERRLGLEQPILVAMGDAPDKPDPTGLIAVVKQLTPDATTAVLYVGDTVADMHTVVRARQAAPERSWWGIGTLPPHVQAQPPTYQDSYGQALERAGAAAVLSSVPALTPAMIDHLLAQPSRS